MNIIGLMKLSETVERTLLSLSTRGITHVYLPNANNVPMTLEEIDSGEMTTNIRPQDGKLFFPIFVRQGFKYIPYDEPKEIGQALGIKLFHVGIYEKETECKK